MSFLNSLNGYLDIPNANLRVNGSGQFSSINVGSTRILAGYDLDTVTSVGSITPYTIEFSNATTGIVTTSNGQIGGDLTVLGNAAVSSNLTVAGNATVSSNLTVVGNATVSSNLNVAGNATVSSNLTVAGNATVSSNLTVAGNATVSSNLTVAGNTMMSSNLTVAGNTTLSSNLVVGGNVQVGTANLFVDTVSSNVGIGTNAPMGTLDVKGVLNHTQVANVAQITSNSNVVMEYRRSKKLIKYPRVYLTSAALNSAYENGYKVTFSRHSASFPAYHAFSLDETNSVGWHTDDGSGSTIEYNGTGGAYSGTTRLATETELGEWIGLELPEAIKLMNVNMASQSYSPITHTVDNFIVYAKKQSGDTWTSLGTFTGVAEYQNSAAGVTVNVDTNNYYKFFAIVVTKRYAVGTDISIRRLDLYGLPEYDPGAHGTDVVLHTTPNVPNTDWLEVYYDGQDYTSMPATVADKSGNGFTGTPSGGVGFDTTYKAFTFDGVDDYIDASVSASFTGNQVYTFSTWIKPDSHPTGFIGIFGIGAATTNNSMGLFLNNGIITHLANGNNLETGTIAKLGKWVHITGTYDGTHRTVFVDGERNGRDSYSSLNLTSTTNFKIGSNLAGAQHFNGSIANFRLYNRPLTADEIWELYSYQKEYFGVSPDVVTLKDGRIGIGTSKPRAVLDVMGGLSCGGVLKIGTAGKDYGPAEDQGPGHYGRKNLFIHSTFGGTATEDYGWWIGAQHQTLTSGDNDLYFTVVRNGVENATAYINDDKNQISMNFTGQHRTFIKNVPFSQAGELEGLIVSSDQNKYIKMSGGIETGSNAITTNESLPVVSLSNVVSDKKCFGVISASEDPEQRSDAFGNFVTPYKKENGDTRVYINSVGEGAIWVVNTNGPLEAGDYITTSNVVGYGQKQDGAGLMNYTVAKITMDCDFNPVTQPIQIIEKGEDGKNVLDEHGQIQWEDHTTETEKAYKIRYIDASGAQTDEANAMYTAAFVGCTYHCG